MKRQEMKTDNRLENEFESFGKAERKILAAAVEVFAQKGFDGARTDEIASRAGVNKAMIYYYFKSKESLYTIIVETVFREISKILAAHLSLIDVTTPQEGITSFIDRYLDFVYAHRMFVKVLMWELARGGAIVARVVRSILHEQTEQIIGVFNEAAGDGHIRPLDPRHLFVSMVGMILFYFFAEPVVRVVWGEDPMTPENITKRKEEITSLIINGILPKQG